MSPTAARRVIIDCDPGVDDAIAIALALASPDEIHVDAITTVAGNVGLDLTSGNALRVCSLAGRPDIPVYAGSSAPLLAPKGANVNVHGSNGLGDVELPEPSGRVQERHAVTELIDRLRRSAEPLTLCVLGPMTNVALVLSEAPDVAPSIREIVFMGGAAYCPGNVTPAAEFNIWADARAAFIVARSGIPLTMIGLDATHQAAITSASLRTLKALPGQSAQAAVRMLTSYGQLDSSLHDPCVIAFLLDETLFSVENVHLEVELREGADFGRTRVVAADDGICRLVTAVQTNRLFDLITARLARLL